MSVIDTLVTDRTAAHAERLKTLMDKGWRNLTPEEKYEYYHGNGGVLRDANNEPLSDRSGDQLFVSDGIQRGAYNHTDLNRVEEAVAYVAAELVQASEDLHDYAESLGVAWDAAFDLPYDPEDYENLVIKTDWREPEDDEPPWVDLYEIARYHANLLLIQSALPVVTTIPESMNGLNYSGANAVEQMLIEEHEALATLVEQIKTLIKGTLGRFYSGELYSGELPMGGDN